MQANQALFHSLSSLCAKMRRNDIAKRKRVEMVEMIL